MEKKKLLTNIFSAILTVLCFASIIFRVMGLPYILGSKPYWAIGMVIDSLTFAAAIAYCSLGYKKSSAKYFHAFSYLYAFGSFVTVLLRCLDYQPTTNLVSIGSGVAVFGITLIFAVARDLGKIRSYVLSLLIEVFMIIDFILVIGNVGSMVAVLGKVVLAAVFFMIIAAKYKDKAERNAT